ncbi:replication-relaxation family protein (plasmid) [Streptomyces sp. NBC_01335]|uniref:replication-relaxation family protein n=1 Tax=Streptomyces sp. NBC_01335 TaxID=2903828 RepID=UPI002E14818B|nr:replication-relaxation family protein [Streptomyces sp. NBC_01335]
MGGASAWPYKSTAKARGLVLLALGIVKVATAEQLRQLVLPGTADTQTVRNACKDLRSVGLVESVGRTSSMSPAGRPVRRDLWNLTAAGLASAASEVGRPVQEMGGTARDAAKAGAPHALAVTDTIDAFRQSPPMPTTPVARRTNTTLVPTQGQSRILPSRPRGLGHLRGWETEVPLPTAGTFTTPARGSLRADAVLTAPEDGVPVLFVEVDNHTEPAAVVAQKIQSYRRFFQRTVKDHQGRDVPLWSTLWGDSGRGGYPPLALVFAKTVSPTSTMNRITTIRDLSADSWRGHWHSDGITASGARDGYQDYTGTVPVIATTLTLLRQHGPHGPVWWRYGHPDGQTLEHALDNPTITAPSPSATNTAAPNAMPESSTHSRSEEPQRQREAAAVSAALHSAGHDQ